MPTSGAYLRIPPPNIVINLNQIKTCKLAHNVDTLNNICGQQASLKVIYRIVYKEKTNKAHYKNFMCILIYNLMSN